MQSKLESTLFLCIYGTTAIFRRIDFRTIPILLILMFISILVIAATTMDPCEMGEETFLQPRQKARSAGLRSVGRSIFFLQGWITASSKNGPGSSILACSSCFIGLFFVPAIQNVHRWYRIPGVNFAFQPSEYAKLIVVMTLSLYLENKGRETYRKSATLDLRF